MTKTPPNFTLIRDPNYTLIRFNEINDLFYYDEFENNPNGLGRQRGYNTSSTGRDSAQIMKYKKERCIISKDQQRIIDQAMKEISVDKDFLDLVHKAKSEKRRYETNKFCGNFSVVPYSRQEDKIFKKGLPGSKKITLDMAFQIGTFQGGNYSKSFVSIIKTILMAQSLGIHLNIDVFDSDTRAVVGKNNNNSYVLCNVSKSSEKLNMRNLLTFSHPEFFHFSLFNGYNAAGRVNSIGSFLSEKTIIKDLSERYDIIGGNMVSDTDVSSNNEAVNNGMIEKILKISWK